MNRASAAATTLVGCLLLAGCTSSSDTTSSGTSAGPPASASGNATGPAPPDSKSVAATITIKDFSFDVAGTAAPGAMIIVTNMDDTAHSVTADSGNTFDVTIQPGKTAMFAAPKSAGSYAFHCTFHSNMQGSLIVVG